MEFDSSRKRPRLGEGGLTQAYMESDTLQSEIQTTSTPAGLTDIRILLLGTSRSGKIFAGNTILGGWEVVPWNSTPQEQATRFLQSAGIQRLAQCDVRKVRYVAARRHLTVVESPGWYDNSPLQDTSEMDKLEIQNSVSLCFPGPHAVLLVVPIHEAFTKAQRVALEEHMTLLSETIWSHTIVLFRNGDRLGDTSIEQHIEAQGEDLRWLVDKCGNRYHVFFNPTESDSLSGRLSRQVTELLEKIDEMVAGNGGGHYEDDAEASEKVSERKRNIEKHAQTLMTKTQRQRTALKAQFEGEHQSLPAVRVMWVGGEKNQRSSAGDVTLQKNVFGQTPLQEFEAQNKLTECVRQQRRDGETNETVVICPYWLTAPPSQKMKDVLLHGVTLCSPGPHAVLVKVPVRSSFSEADRRSVEEHMELLGDRVWRHAVVLFTQTDWLERRPVEEYIESEGEPLKWLLEKCGYRYHVFDQFWLKDRELMDTIENMVMRNGGHLGSSDSREDRSVGDTRHFKTECYTLSRNPRGRCLIINNEIFTVGLETRHGTQKDQEALERVFSRLGFKVEVHRNKTACEIRCVLGDLGRQDFTKADALVVCVLTHGMKGYVLGTDGGQVLLRELKQPFISESAPTLAGKPKLFFIQACQGDVSQYVRPRSSIQADSLSLSPVQSVSWYADFLMGMAAVEEFKTFRHVDTGSFYTQELCRQLEAAADSGEDIHSVLTAVNREVGKREYPVDNSYDIETPEGRQTISQKSLVKQMPECRHTLTKKLVLNFI